LYSAPALSCNADGIGSSAQRTVAAATVQPTAPTTRKTPVDKPVVAVAAPTVTAGAATANDDAGSSLGESIGVGTHRRGLRWQSFLPGVIK